MKCPECNANQKYSSGMKCTCGYEFVLDPKSDKMADGKFLAIIRGASGNDTYYFTEHQLYTSYCRRLYTNPLWYFIIGAALIGMAVGIALFLKKDIGPVLAWIFAIIGAILVLAGVASIFGAPPDRDELTRALAKWQRTRGSLEKLITQPALHEPPPDWPEPDIYDYGVEGLLVVERDILVDLLVRNGFHATSRVLVIAESGYPKYLVPQAAKALADNPELPIYFLHDATDSGLAMAARMKESQFVREASHPTFDLGLFPYDVRRIGRLAPLRARKADYKLAVDFLPYAMLSLGLVQAIEQQISLGMLLAAPADGGGDGSSGFG